MVSPVVVDDDFVSSMEYFRKKPEGSGFIEACSKNPSFFAEHMLGWRPFAWQVYAMELFRRRIESRASYLGQNIGFAGFDEGPLKGGDDNKEVVLLTSRQIGKSTMKAMLGLWVLFFNKVPMRNPGNSSNVIVVSASDIQARKLLNEMKRLMRSGNVKMSEYTDSDGKQIFGDKFFDRFLSKEDSNSASQISVVPWVEKFGDYFLGGRDNASKLPSVIKSYPPTSSVLGEAMSVIFIDEAGQSDRITDSFFEELYPVGDNHLAIRGYASTPWGHEGFFYRMVDPDGIYNRDDVTIVPFTVEAIAIENPSVYNKRKKDIERYVKHGRTDFVRRAYYCEFVKGDSAFFNPDKVRDCFDGTMSVVSSWKEPCDVGVDFGGQTKSRSVITISTVDKDGVVRRLYTKTYAPQQDDNIVSDLKSLHKVFNIDRITVDDCPGGSPFIRLMEKEGWFINRMNFRSEKVRKYSAFRRLLNKGLVKSYPDDNLRTEMNAMEYAGNTRQSYIQHAPGYSDDLIDSFVMSCYYYVDDDESGKPSFFEW